MASRAHLLAGLRTGGPRSTSPFDEEGFQQDQANYLQSDNTSPQGLSGILKANAAPFTPGSRVPTPAAKQMDAPEGQVAALRMQQAITSANLGRQGSPSLMEGRTDAAAMYGASQGQPNRQQRQGDVDYQQQEMANLIRQRQAQMVQNQLLAQQQQQQQQQMELYRLQAASQQQQQQQHLQQVAAQQRMLLAQMQAEYNQQQQDQAFSAHDQRLAAQANLQASLRQRQTEQMYSQLMEQQQGGNAEDAQLQQQFLLQRLQFLQLQAAANAQMQEQSMDDHLTNGASRRNGSPRSDSPNSAAASQARRDRQASQMAADNATSWRSTSISLAKGAATKASNATPSIVVDDSGSEKSEEASNGFGSDNETPETSEEDVGALSSSASTIGKSPPTHRLSALSLDRRTPSTLLSANATPRPISLSQAPRKRAFTAEAKTAASASGSGGTNAASRQPRGPPTEFHSINFTSRLSARTRREAMSKLCASPRAASFSSAPRPVVIA